MSDDGKAVGIGVLKGVGGFRISVGQALVVHTIQDGSGLLIREGLGGGGGGVIGRGGGSGWTRTREGAGMDDCGKTEMKTAGSGGS